MLLLVRSLATLSHLVTSVASTAPVDDPATIVRQRGEASYYSDKLQGKPTASGLRHSQDAMTAASPTLPIGTRATVTNEETGKKVEVQVNDRGPSKYGRIIDVSKRAAIALGMRAGGIARVTVEAKPSEQPTRALRDDVIAAARRLRSALSR